MFYSSVNSLQLGVAYLYPLKISENLQVTSVTVQLHLFLYSVSWQFQYFISHNFLIPMNQHHASFWWSIFPGLWLMVVMLESDALRDLVAFVQFKKREKHPRRSVNFKPATLLKLTHLHGFFSRFLNCTNGTKSRNAPQKSFQILCCPSLSC